jgi:uncharacterized protein GlcG (DUF336 family)
MNPSRACSVAIALTVLGLSTAAPAQQAPPPYGMPISLEQARKCVTAAEAEARKNSWNVVVAVLDAGGHLVLLQRMDGAQWGSVETAREKGYSAVAYRRPSKAFEDALGQPMGVRVLRLPGASPLEGGLPIVMDGRLVGGVGVSGVLSTQDAQIARACLDGLK